jgi:hypothetical protein
MSTTTERVTAAQQQRLDALRAEGCDRRLYTYNTRGATITGQFRRYLEREDASCVEKALYGFLTVTCSFIAEMALAPPDGNFRSVWAEPADMIDALPGETRYVPARRGHVGSVYSDGMTDVEVLHELDRLAAEHREACLLGRQDRRFNREISALVQLADVHQFTIVPPGWRLGKPDEAGATAEPPGSLAAALVALAQRNGQTLISPLPGPDSTGQTRLL